MGYLGKYRIGLCKNVCDNYIFCDWWVVYNLWGIFFLRKCYNVKFFFGKNFGKILGNFLKKLFGL